VREGIEGLSDNTMIANRFAEHFSKIGNLAFNKFKHINISDRLDKYWGDLPLGMNISVEQLDGLTSKMKEVKLVVLISYQWNIYYLVILYLSVLLLKCIILCLI
jgi:hypothetical protein